ncbi:MAG: diacylglycerol kinase family lipid kinase [Candidatus Aminicenantes bacterium]|nr:diacylglycerol kinase family lipid kinase [Candidatus Aminicenantes bacterium]
MRIIIVYNPQAAHGRTKKILPRVNALFEEKGIDVDIHMTQYPKNGIEIVKEINFAEYDGIIAAGGDGTLFEVINGYFLNPGKKRIPIGILPIGTGNAFAKDLYVDSSKWEDAIDVISLNRPKKVDVGRVKTQGKEFYYMNILGLGFVSDVTKTAYRLKFFGNISYTLGVLYQTAFLKPHQLTIELDGKKLTRENIFVEISNTRYTSNFFMAPAAKIDDGFLDVTLLKKTTRRKLLKAFPKVFTGEHVNLDIVETFKAQHIKIATDIPKVLTPDGEIFGETPLEIDCLEKAVEIFAG